MSFKTPCYRCGDPTGMTYVDWMTSKEYPRCKACDGKPIAEVLVRVEFCDKSDLRNSVQPFSAAGTVVYGPETKTILRGGNYGSLVHERIEEMFRTGQTTGAVVSVAGVYRFEVAGERTNTPAPPPPTPAPIMPPIELRNVLSILSNRLNGRHGPASTFALMDVVSALDTRVEAREVLSDMGFDWKCVVPPVETPVADEK
jgi:hypothetical protein